MTGPRAGRSKKGMIHKEYSREEEDFFAERLNLSERQILEDYHMKFPLLDRRKNDLHNKIMSLKRAVGKAHQGIHSYRDDERKFITDRITIGIKTAGISLEFQQKFGDRPNTTNRTSRALAAFIQKTRKKPLASKRYTEEEAVFFEQMATSTMTFEDIYKEYKKTFPTKNWTLSALTAKIQQASGGPSKRYTTEEDAFFVQMATVTITTKELHNKYQATFPRRNRSQHALGAKLREVKEEISGNAKLKSKTNMEDDLNFLQHLQEGWEEYTIFEDYVRRNPDTHISFTNVQAQLNFLRNGLFKGTISPTILKWRALMDRLVETTHYDQATIYKLCKTECGVLSDRHRINQKPHISRALRKAIDQSPKNRRYFCLNYARSLFNPDIECKQKRSCGFLHKNIIHGCGPAFPPYEDCFNEEVDHGQNGTTISASPIAQHYFRNGLVEKAFTKVGQCTIEYNEHIETAFVNYHQLYCAQYAKRAIEGHRLAPDADIITLKWVKSTAIPTNSFI